MANSVDPDQMPHFAASDLGLHCFKDVSVPILSVITVILFQKEIGVQGNKHRSRRSCLFSEKSCLPCKKMAESTPYLSSLIMPVLRSYAALLQYCHAKSLNKVVIPIFLHFCVRCFQGQQL